MVKSQLNEKEYVLFEERAKYKKKILNDVKNYAENNIGLFHQKRIQKLEKLELTKILKSKNPDKGNYFKYCGQEFWAFITGDENFYLDIIEPLGHKSKEKTDLFNELYTQLINKFTLEFSAEFCDNGKINWEKLIKFNSSRN